MDSTTLIHLTCIVLSESSQSWKATYCMIPLLWHFQQTKLWGRKHISGFQGLGFRFGLGLGGGHDGDKEQQHFWSDGTISNLDGGDGFIKICSMVPLKMELCT